LQKIMLEDAIVLFVADAIMLIVAGGNVDSW
jgi:hypothetical protein